MNHRDGWITRVRVPRVISDRLERIANRKLAFYVLRNSGPRIWLADRLVTIAGHLNPAKPWKRTPPSVSVEPAVHDVRLRYVRLRQINNELDVLATSPCDDTRLATVGYDLRNELRKMPRSGHRDAALLRVLTICFKFPIGSAHRILDDWNASDARNGSSR